MIIRALRLACWLALAYAVLWIAADAIVYELHVRPAMNAATLEFIISPRYPTGALPDGK